MSDLIFFPSRPAWRADSLEDALDRLGYSHQDALTLVAASAMDEPLSEGWRTHVFERAGVPDMRDVLIPSDDPSGSFCVVADGYYYLGSDTEEGARANWPYDSLVYVTMQAFVKGFA